MCCYPGYFSLLFHIVTLAIMHLFICDPHLHVLTILSANEHSWTLVMQCCYGPDQTGKCNAGVLVQMMDDGWMMLFKTQALTQATYCRPTCRVCPSSPSEVSCAPCALCRPSLLHQGCGTSLRSIISAVKVDGSVLRQTAWINGDLLNDKAVCLSGGLDAEDVSVYDVN